MRPALPWIVVALLLAGCSRVTLFGHEVVGERAATQREVAPQSAAASAAVAESPAAVRAAPRVSAVLIKFSADAQQQMQDEPRFTARALREAVLEELTSRGLLGDAGGGDLVDIQVDEFSLRNTSNVVVFGSIATAGKLGAVLEVQAAGGSQLKRAEVRVEAALTLRKDGENPDELRKLYRRFAQAIADEIAGTAGSREAEGYVRP